MRVVWITGRGSAATARRARELGCELFAKVADKGAALAAVQAAHGVGPDATLAMGDDLADLDMAERAALFCAPSDARPEVRARAALVTSAAGGRGAVRELCDVLLAARSARGGVA